jgi:DNA-binding CsgD family transcriptional regulator
MAFAIVSREDEVALLHAFVARAEQGPAALLLEGEAGIGKSTLWRAGVEHARDEGLRVLSSRPAEAERGLAYAGLSDLFEGVLDDVLPALSLPRRRALEVALLLEDAPGEPVDRRALGVAVRESLELLADRGPLLIAVDDVQWLDASSASTLAFALRRIAARPVLLMLARRLVDGGDRPSELEQALGTDRVDHLRVDPMSVGALHQLLRDRLGRPFGRQTMLRIHERSGGNPFFALELARVLEPDVDPLQPLPVPETLEELLRARLAGLPASTRDALALASAIGAVSEADLERAGFAPDVLQPAVAAQVIERDRGTVRFAHPLLSSVIYKDLGEQARSVHERVAEVADDPLVRARHLALSKDRPDADVAAAIDDAVKLAADRGASAAAAELAEQAWRLTPVDEGGQHHRRALAAARAHHAAGEWTRARTIAQDLLAEAETGPLRAEVLVLLAELESQVDSIAVLREALREAAPGSALQSVIHCRLAWEARFRGGFDHARVALEIAEELHDGVLIERARAVRAVLGWFAGHAEVQDELLALARDLAAALGGEKRVQEATQAVVNTLAPSSMRGRARAMLERQLREWRDRNEPRSANALWGLSWVELWAGRWELAAEHAARAHDISIQYGLEAPQDHLPIALVAVHRGQLEHARAHSERALRLADEQFGLHPPQHMAILGLAAFWDGDPAGALQWFDQADRRAAELRWREPSVRWWTCDYVELLLEVGQIDEAVQILEVWDEDARRVGREWVLAHVTRCRGLVAAARGDVGQAVARLQQAVAEHETVGVPFGRARALLALGTVRRRARQKRAAREAIRAALGDFEQLGAATWVEKARGELGRIGGRKREEGLTSAESRVATLVAEGRTNREVAATLFLAERTVASHLTHIYAKLGIRSRTELARRLR